MRIKNMVVLSVLLLSQLAFASASKEKGAVARTASFQLEDETEIPEGVLKSGSYSIHIADHLADRFVVEIRNAEGTADSKFLAVPARNIPKTAPLGPVMSVGATSKSALRGFSFTGGQVVEFVYPKNDAVALAKANGVTVLAIDPTSDGISSAAGLSADDMKIVTLWMLTPTPVSPNQKAGIEAARYQAPASATSERAEARPSVISRLPKTASMLPLLGIAGIGALAFALVCCFFRFRAGVI